MTLHLYPLPTCASTVPNEPFRYQLNCSILNCIVEVLPRQQSQLGWTQYTKLGMETVKIVSWTSFLSAFSEVPALKHYGSRAKAHSELFWWCLNGPRKFSVLCEDTKSGYLRPWANVASGCSCLLSAYSQGLKADLSPTVSPDGYLTFQFRVRTEVNVCTKDLPSQWSVFLLLLFSPPLFTFQILVDILRYNAIHSEPHTFQVFVFDTYLLHICTPCL